MDFGDLCLEEDQADSGDDSENDRGEELKTE